jgi:hypothetical protein
MKLLVYSLIVCLGPISCLAQTFKKKQILIPLDNSKGVPFHKEAEVNDYYVNGFEIDDNGNFYFLGGDKALCLAVFSGSNLKYRKIYKEIPLGTYQLYLSKDTLYTFNSLPPNKIFAIDPANGLIIKTYESMVSEKVNSYSFEEDHLIIQSIGSSDIIYNQYSLTGKLARQGINRYNLPFRIPVNTEFLGMWNDQFVFYRISGKNLDKQEFFTTDRSGKVSTSTFLPNTNLIFGNGYAEDPAEDRKVRNGNLYVLGRKGKFALITEIPLQSLFNLH